MRIQDSDGRVLICAELDHLPEIVRGLKDNWSYCYYYGQKLESGMSEEEIYKTIYNSKEAYERDFPEDFFSEEEIYKKRNIELDMFLDAIKDYKPDLYELLLQRKSSGDKLSVDTVSLQFLLDLNRGVPYEELAYLLSEHGSSGYAHSHYTNFLLEFSPKGRDFVEYLINEKNFSIYKRFLEPEAGKKVK